jgi:hypothetical protein
VQDNKQQQAPSSLNTMSVKEKKMEVGRNKNKHTEQKGISYKNKEEKLQIMAAPPYKAPIADEQKKRKKLNHFLHW